MGSAAAAAGSSAGSLGARGGGGGGGGRGGPSGGRASGRRGRVGARARVRGNPQRRTGRRRRPASAASAEERARELSDLLDAATVPARGSSSVGLGITGTGRLARRPPSKAAVGSPRAVAPRRGARADPSRRRPARVPPSARDPRAARATHPGSDAPSDDDGGKKPTSSPASSDERGGSAADYARERARAPAQGSFVGAMISFG